MAVPLYNPQVMRVYVETSVWGMVQEDQPEGLRQPTLQFLDECRMRIHQPHISAVVIDEVRRSALARQSAILAKIAELDPIQLAVTTEATELARRFIAAGILPTKAPQ